jgi:hypothetical protein
MRIRQLICGKQSRCALSPWKMRTPPHSNP